MKTIKTICLSTVAALLCSLSFVSFAQTQSPAPRIYHVTTFYVGQGLDSIGSAQRAAVVKEYHDKVTMKNELILRSWSMVHYFSDDSREFVTINEYANWNDIDKAATRDEELAKKAWPNSKQRSDFMNKLNSYFTGHKDAIYTGVSNLVK